MTTEQRTPYLYKGGHKSGQKVLIDPKINIVWTLDKSKKPYKIVKYRNVGNGILILIKNENQTSPIPAYC